MATESEPVVPELDNDPPGMSARAWLQLFRLPNVFTAMADIFLGYLLVHDSLEPWWSFLLLLGASCLLYTSGMILNDVFDVAVDRQERPARPIPSGRIPLSVALHTGGVMLGSGVAFGWAASALVGEARPGIVATALAVAVLAYDRVLKRTPVAPLIMGSCRTLNVLLGASTAAGAWHTIHYIVAAGVGLYITGVTWFARTEARQSNRMALAAATVVMAAGLTTLAYFPSAVDDALELAWTPLYALEIGSRWYVLWGLLGLLILRRPAAAIAEPIPRRVQLAVKECILSLIVIDAVVCYSVRGVPWAIVILVLLVPTLVLGRWIYST
ncbi:MAG TPA: UbiA family prenyltransferase [Pirellulales bacterium]|nr:UbiA family prenyltransferase [Pirellulales bacterium]